MKLISLLLLLTLGTTTVLGSSTTILQNLIRGSALKCLADLGGGLRACDRKVFFATFASDIPHVAVHKAHHFHIVPHI